MADQDTRQSGSPLVPILMNVIRVGIVGGVAGALLGLVLGFVLPLEWKSQAKLIPTSAMDRSTQGLGANALMQAAQGLGVNIPGGSGPDLSSLLPAIMESRDFAVILLSKEYPVADGDSRTLLELLSPNKDGTDPEKRLASAVRKLTGAVLGHQFDARTGVSRVSVVMEDPELAVAIARDVIAEIDAFIRQLYQRHALDRVRFIQSRMQDAESRLSDAEERLRVFLDRNRVSLDSPQLIIQQGRLEREVEVQQQIYLTLKTQFELAQIEAERSVPNIGVIEAPAKPTEKHSPRRAMLVIGLGVLVGAIACVLFLARLTWIRLREAEVSASR